MLDAIRKLIIRQASRAGGRARRAFAAWGATVHPHPVLVLGNHKSGTTAIAALLAELTGRTVALDLEKEIARPTYQRVRSGRMTVDAFIRRNRLDFSRQIIKEPNLLVIYRQIARQLPAAQPVLLIRDPRDNIRSILNRLALPGHLERLERPYHGVHARAWNLYLDGRWLGLDAETYVEVLAERWNLAADIYLAQREAMVLIRYEDFLRDKAGQIARLAERLGLPAVRDIRHAVDRQYQPRGDRHVSWDDFFGPRNLVRIEQRCGARMAALGYALGQKMAER
jgi:hypothetical protein